MEVDKELDKKLARRIYDREWARNRKIKFLKELGVSGCQQCGYNKCPGALVFHHIDPLRKEVKMSNASLYRAAEEFKTGNLLVLCANCHSELHYNEEVSIKSIKQDLRAEYDATLDERIKEANEIELKFL